MRPYAILIRSCEIDFAFGRFAADNTDPFFIGLIERNVTCGGFGVFLDPGFTFCGFTPIRKSPSILDHFLELIIGLDVMDVCIPKFGGSLEE